MSGGALTYSEIKSELFKSLEQHLCLSIANLTHKSQLKNIDVYKISVQSYRKLNQLLQVFSDSVVEMIASSYNYKPETFFILDIKFLTWKVWLEVVLALSRFYMIDKSINGTFRNTVKGLAIKAKAIYEEKLFEDSDDLDIEFIHTFKDIHEETFVTFFRQLDSVLDNWDGSNSVESMIDLVNDISYHIIFWMQYTVFEVLSLDRCYYNPDKPVVIISGVVVEAASKYNVNLVKKIKDYLHIRNDITLRHTHPDLMNYSYLFEGV